MPYTNKTKQNNEPTQDMVQHQFPSWQSLMAGLLANYTAELANDPIDEAKAEAIGMEMIKVGSTLDGTEKYIKELQESI